MLSESDTFALLVFLIVAALIVIGWAVATLDEDEPEGRGATHPQRGGSRS